MPQFHLSRRLLSWFCTLAACLGLRKNEVLAVKKVKSSLSSSRLQYPLLMLLLLVMEGVSTSLTVMERSQVGPWHQNSTRQKADSLRKCRIVSKRRADVTLSHGQSLEASNCLLLIQKKSELLCWCIQRVYVQPLRTEQVNSAQIQHFGCYRRGDQEIRERAPVCHFLLTCVCHKHAKTI